MLFPTILAEASGRSSGLFFVLFLAFAIAAIVWLLIWLFSEGDADEYSIRSGAESDASSDSGASDAGEEIEPVEKVDGEDESDISSEREKEENGSDVSPDPVGAGAVATVAEPIAAKEENSSPSAADSAPAEEDDDDFEAATEEEAANVFAAELEAGEVEQDSVYGIIYKEAPSEVDDLKEIKGVAKVLEGKLNSIGVYRFKQVAVWTDAACAEFSKMLTFKNRIYTDNWLDQAKEFHEKKYGEKL